MLAFRKMTMGEVAEIAGDAKETIRARINRGVRNKQTTPGWARFDVPTTVEIAVEAEVLRNSGDHEIAFKAAVYVGDCLHDYWRTPIKPIKRTGQLGGSCIIFRRSAIDPKSLDVKAFFTEEMAGHALGQFLFDTREKQWSGFYFLNASTLCDWALDRIFDLQGIDGNTAEAHA